MGNERRLKQSGIAECVMHYTSDNECQFNLPLQQVTITHPQHPLRGQSCEIIEVNRAGSPSIRIRHPDGMQSTMPLSWTNYVESPDPSSSSGASHLLDVNHLLDVVRIVARIKSGDLEAPQ